MKNLTTAIQKRFEEMAKAGKLFRVELSGQKIWDLYLASFPADQDPIFRDPSSSSHNCNHCNNFIRRYANIVSIDDKFNIVSMFDVNVDEEYQPSMTAINDAIVKSKIVNVFFETFNELNELPYEVCKKTNTVFRLGVDKNTKRYTEAEAQAFGYDSKTKIYSAVQPNELRTFNHFYLDISKYYVDMSGKSIESIMSNYRSDFDVFERGMREISLDTLELVRDLINQGSLLDGTTHLHKIEKMIPLKKAYDKLGAKDKINFCWVSSFELPIAKFRNELIGTLCQELSEGKDINEACKTWNIRVDPVNYMKVKAPISKKHIEEAKKFVEENGYEESFDRRYATIDDIKVSEIHHINSGDGKLKNTSIFDGVKPATSTRHKKNEFEGIEKVTIDKFMKDILPTCTSVEAFLQANHSGNMATMTTSNVKDSKPIFKHSNNYSLTFNGNLAGKSQIAETVNAYGGKTSGVLRFSIMWAENTVDDSDLDAHCLAPNFHINFGNKRDPKSGGNLDIDITRPSSQRKPGEKAVAENITFPDLSKMTDGVYQFYVHQFAERNSKGVKMEICFGDEVYYYEINSPLSNKSRHDVAKVTLKNGEFTIQHQMKPSSDSIGSSEIYGLATSQFHRVNLVCLSPNHWDENKVGNKYFMFMLENCKTPNSIRSFHIENLIPELLAHKRVMEVLGGTNMIEPDPNAKQLSGLGFNSTVNDELILKLQGSFKRTVKVVFG